MRRYFQANFLLSIVAILFLGGSAPSELALGDIEKDKNTVFKQLSSLQAPAGACPQSRYTDKVPLHIFNKRNP
jgi:hypothetical protein